MMVSLEKPGQPLPLPIPARRVLHRRQMPAHLRLAGAEVRLQAELNAVRELKADDWAWARELLPTRPADKEDPPCL